MGLSGGWTTTKGIKCLYFVRLFATPNLLHRIWNITIYRIGPESRNDISQCFASTLQNRTEENRKENDQQCLADLADDMGIATIGKAGPHPGWSMAGAARVAPISLVGMDSSAPRVPEPLDGTGARRSSRR